MLCKRFGKKLFMYMNFMHQMRCERESFLKIYTADKNFTGPLVAPVVPNITSADHCDLLFACFVHACLPLISVKWSSNGFTFT